MSDSDVVIHKIDEGHLKILCDRPIAAAIKKSYEFFAPGYRFHPNYIKNFRSPKEKRFWDGKVSLFNMKTKIFPFGLLEDLTAHFDKYNVSYEYMFPTDKLKNYDIDDAFLEKFYKEIFVDSEYYPRDYQHTAIRQLLLNKKAVVEEATGSGKSLIIYCLIRYLLSIGKRIVLVVPNIMLVEQMKSDFKDYGWEDCERFLTIMYEGHIPDIRCPVLVSTYQSLIKQTDSFIMRFDSVIVDEVHQAPANSIQTILKKLPFTEYRLGMTGTLPDHSDPEQVSKVYEIYGSIGPLVAQKTASELMEEGYLSKLKIANLIIKYPENMCIRNRNRPYDEEMSTIIDSHDRMWIFNYILRRIPENENSIILCYQIKHLEAIYNHITKHFGDKFKIYKIHGSVSPEERMAIKAIAECDAGVVIVATYGTMSIGVNIKRLHNVILGSSRKSKISILQTIGRGLRLHETKAWLTLFDIVDDLRWKKRTGRIGLNHCWEQFLIRLGHYKNQKFEFTNKIIRLEDISSLDTDLEKILY